jgi:hypothetical protein
MHVALTADLSKMLKKSGKIYKATPGGSRLSERESQLKQEQDQNLPNIRQIHPSISKLV